jgi:hypothetical protein
MDKVSIKNLEDRENKGLHCKPVAMCLLDMSIPEFYVSIALNWDSSLSKVAGYMLANWV